MISYTDGDDIKPFKVDRGLHRYCIKSIKRELLFPKIFQNQYILNSLLGSWCASWKPGIIQMVYRKL